MCNICSSCNLRRLPEHIAYYCGKVLECASFALSPMEQRICTGTITKDDETMGYASEPCTIVSVAGHAMYERSNLIMNTLRWNAGYE